jgi:hypothetical protein
VGGSPLAKNVCIVIAVAEPDKPLDPLPGAVPSAKQFATWASGQGYQVELVTDENQTPVTCERLGAAFHNALGGGGQNRILVAFMGHGLIRGQSEEYWLLTDWRRKATEAVNHLKLRSRLETYRPKQIGIISDACRSLPTESAKWVEGNGVVDVMDYIDQPVQVAQLSGTRSAQPSFQTPLGAEEQYCFFSQVLTNALRGEPHNVVEVDDQGRRVVVNDRLYEVVERELPRLASRYQRRQIPQLDGSWRSRPSDVWSVLPDAPVEPRPIVGPGPDVANDLAFRSAWDEKNRDEVARDRTERFRKQLRGEVRASHFETGCGLSIVGAPVREVIAPPGFKVGCDEKNPAWFHLSAARPAGSVAVQLKDGRWLAGAVYDGMIGTFTVTEDGAAAFVLRPVWDNTDLAEEAVARAATNAVTNHFELAALLRREKHADPVLGALAAYAYARAGAIEDIRRTCSFYAERGQPLPFDAALLARVPLTADGPWLIADIPAVAERKPHNDTEAKYGFTYEATPGGRVPVAGGFPWLRQGWALLEDRREFRELATFTEGLRPSVFTTLNPRRGRELAELIRKGEL